MAALENLPDPLSKFYVTDMDPGVLVQTPVLEALNEYQVASLQKMVMMETGANWDTTHSDHVTILASCVGFLANKVGTGKTRIALALALSSIYPTSVTDEVFTTVTNLDGHAQRLIAGTLNHRVNNLGRCNPAALAIHNRQRTVDKDTLIVVPSALLPQWKNELTKLQVAYEEVKDEVVVTRASHKIFIRLVDKVTTKPERFCRVIYDECDSVLHQNPAKKSRHFTWLLSATPANILPNRYPFVFGSVLEKTLRQLVPYNGHRSYIQGVRLEQLPLMVKAKDSYIQSMINLPAVHTVCHTVSKPMLRQLQPDAPLIMGTTAKIYLQRLEGDLLKQHESNQLNADAKAQLQAQIERVASQLECLADDKGTCPICLNEPPATPVMTNCCQQSFCKYCLLHCDQHRCPFCRKARFGFMPVFHNEQNEVVLERITRDDAMLKIIELQKTYLLVGNSSEIGRITNVLSSHNITASFMNKTHKQITALKEKQIQVLIFDCREFGCGLDLSFVDEIIIYADLHSCHFTQVTGRLCRLGRERPVIVHTFKEE